MDRIEWKADDRQYTNGDNGFIGEYIAFSVFYDSCRPKDDPMKYKLTGRLFGVREILGLYETKEEAKAKAELVLANWTKKTGLCFCSK